MKQPYDLTNKKFGKLIVIKQYHKRGNRGQIKWKCKCDCGNNHITTGECLRSGKSKSCGCLRKNPPHNKITDRNLAIWKQIYHSTIVKRNKKKYKINCNISLEEFIKISKMPCYYCNIKYSNIATDRRNWCKNKKISNTKILFNGIDRIDSTKPYLLDNIVPCCKHCNRAKNDMNIANFKKYIKKLYKHLFQLSV